MPNKPLSPHSNIPRNERDQLGALAELLRQNGWKVEVNPRLGDRFADLLISRKEIRYVAELKVSSEGRRDRLVPLLSQAILQANALAMASPDRALPLAIVVAPSISASVVAHLRSFLAEYAPDSAVGILDHQCLQLFVGPGLEELNAPRSSTNHKKLPLPESAPLFSDLNQWMLKVLLAPLLPEALLNAPRSDCRNASDLAEAAGVSMMSAFRLLRQLKQEGFLDSGSEILRLVRREALMRRWHAAHLRSVPELPLRWIISSKKANQLPAALRSFVARPSVNQDPVPRICLGLFAAAEQLGLGFVHGAPQNFYLERLNRDVFAELGLSPEQAERNPDVFVRVPAFRESLFRGAVLRDGIPVADILQVWLDVANHPSRGSAQALEIERRVLGPIFKENS
jgi:hypothetical protein